MDVGAELALRLARLVQQRTFAPDGFDAWFLVPTFRKVSWADARDLLSAAPKPLIVSPLPDPGFLGLWPLATVPETDVAGSRHHVANQVAYFRAKLTGLGYTTEDHVSFADGEELLTLSVPEFLSWCAEYAVFAGTTVERREEAGIAWLVVVRPRPRAPDLETPQTPRPAS